VNRPRLPAVKISESYPSLSNRHDYCYPDILVPSPYFPNRNKTAVAAMALIDATGGTCYLLKFFDSLCEGNV